MKVYLRISLTVSSSSDQLAMAPEMLSRSLGALFPPRHVRPPQEQSKVPTMPSGLMDLPLEIRRKIYYQVIIDTRLEPLDQQKPSPATAHHCMRRRRPFMNSNTKNLLLGNKSTNTEVSEVLFFEHYYEIQINSHNVTSHHLVSWQLYLMRHWPSPAHLGKLRNIRICLGIYTWGEYRDVEDMNDVDTSRKRCLRLLCNALVRQCYGLKRVILEINCDCQCREWYGNKNGKHVHKKMNSRGIGPDEEDDKLYSAKRIKPGGRGWMACLDPVRFRNLLAPLAVLRGLQWGGLASTCQSFKGSSNLWKILRESLAVTKTSEPGEPTSVLLDALYCIMTSDRRLRIESPITRAVELEQWEAWSFLNILLDGDFGGLPKAIPKAVWRVAARESFCVLLIRAEMCGHLLVGRSIYDPRRAFLYMKCALGCSLRKVNKWASSRGF